MIMGDRLRLLREQRGLSQAEIEERTGLLCCYVSRVENGHTVPAVKTLEKFAHALEVPLYQLFYDGEQPPQPISPDQTAGDDDWGSRKKDAIMLGDLRRLLGRMDPKDRNLLFSLAQKMAEPRWRQPSARPYANETKSGPPDKS